jgi:hypothetical protein
MSADVSTLKTRIHEDIYQNFAPDWDEEYEDDEYEGLFTEDDQIWWRMRDKVEEEWTMEAFDEEGLLNELEDIPMSEYAEIYNYWKYRLSPTKNTFDASNPHNSHLLFEYMMTTPHRVVLEVVLHLMPDICCEIADDIISDRNIIRKKTFCKVSKLPCVVNELICEYVAE